MLSDEALAGLKTMDRADTITALSAMYERVGDESLRKAMNQVMVQNTPIEEMPNFLSVGAFLRSVGDPPPMLVDRLIPEKSLILLTGKPKLGKSFFALQVAEDVERGRPVCGSFAVNRPGPVCYMGMEDGQFEIANRLLKRGRKMDEERGLYICSTRVILSTPEGIAILQSMIESLPERHREPVLIVIDTARESLGIRDSNDASQVSDALRPLREFARENCTVLLVAHNRKQAGENDGDEIAGSSAFASSVDGWISGVHGTKMENKNRRIVFKIVGRGAMNGDFTAEMDTIDLQFREVPTDEIRTEREQEKQGKANEGHAVVVRAISSLMDRKGTVKVIAERMGVTYETGRKAVLAAEQAKLIERTGETSKDDDGPGRPAPVYGLCFDTYPTAPMSEVGEEHIYNPAPSPASKPGLWLPYSDEDAPDGE